MQCLTWRNTANIKNSMLTLKAINAMHGETQQILRIVCSLYSVKNQTRAIEQGKHIYSKSNKYVQVVDVQEVAIKYRKRRKQFSLLYS